MTTDIQNPVETISVADLSSYEGPLFVVNNSRSVVSCDDGENNYLKIGPVTSEENVQALPKKVAMSIGFQKLWRRGVVTVSKDPNTENELLIQGRREQSRRDEEMAVINASVSESANHKDIHVGNTMNDRGQANTSVHFGDTPPGDDYTNWTQATTPKGETYWTPVTVEGN